MSKRNPWNALLCYYPYSEKINRCSLLAEVLYCRLIAQSDDNGNYHADPQLIGYKLFPERLANGTATIRKLKRARDELVTNVLVKLYRVRNETYLHIENVFKTLRPDVKRDIRFPDLSESEAQQPLPGTDTDTGRTRNENVPLGLGLGEGEGTSTPIFDFEELWKKYPRKEGKTKAKLSFEASVKTESDWNDINKALDNYVALIETEGREFRFIKHGSTWFNNWRDYVEDEAGSGANRKPVYPEAKLKEGLEFLKGKGIDPTKIEEIEERTQFPGHYAAAVVAYARNQGSSG